MTTAVKPSPVHAKPPAPAAAQKPVTVPILYQGLVPIANIDVRENIRKTFNTTKHAEMVASVREHGINQAVLLMPSDKQGRYWLVAGERRLRAAKEAPLMSIPAMVKAYATWEQAVVAQAVENLQRENNTPIEEARGFLVLTQPSKDGKAAKYTVEQVAQLVDKSTAYVYRSMALLDLPKETIKAIENGTLTPAHGHQILRVAPFEREALAKTVLEDGYDGEIMTASDLRTHVEAQLGSNLALAKFPKDKPYAGKIACAVCPFNSGNQGMLFDGAEKGRCTESKCFGEKTVAARTEFVAKVRAKYSDAKEIMDHAGNYYVGTGATDKGWICTGELKGNPPKEYRLTINPDDSLQLWVPKRAEKKKAQAQSRPPQVKRDLKAEFVEEREAVEAVRILALKTKVFTREAGLLMAAALLDFGVNDQVLKALEINLDKVNIEKMPLEQLTQLVILGNVISEYDNKVSDRQIKGFKMDVAKVRAEAKKKAQVAWDSSWGLKHRSTGNSGSDTACGTKGLNYKEPTEKGIAVVDEKQVTCPDCKKAKR
jgi:ParB/RepB/Spo0J family partition protein